ncbi:serine hydrolase [Erythrobacter sp.]|uniref:serine hydrolase n=1 Tax=Erythrobacter sp. TaxID=1042 RepID=UPI0025CED71B|nr:serine hydrolase [Erythrobacter sp.]
MKIHQQSVAEAAVALSLILTSSGCAGEVEYSAATLKPGGPYSIETAGNAVDGAVYQAGSLAKYACTILALRFVDPGKLDLDQTLESVFPDEEMGEAGCVSVPDLLANRSGLRDGQRLADLDRN